jgi:hypothetical protein
MKLYFISVLLVIFAAISIAGIIKKGDKPETIPFILDHNRMMIDVEIQKKDGSWRKARLWIDSGYSEFFISEQLAKDLGIDLSENRNTMPGSYGIYLEEAPAIRIGNILLDMKDIKSSVRAEPYWSYKAMNNDGNLPASVLRKYHVIFDYPKQLFTIAEPGILKPGGTGSKISIHPLTGIIQMDAEIKGEHFSFALDIGASYSFISDEKIQDLKKLFPESPDVTGTAGCANMWGWFPKNEQIFPLIRIPEMRWGNNTLKYIGFAGWPKFTKDGPTFAEWYSRKTDLPVDGILGPNALKAFRIDIDYANKMIYFEKGSEFEEHDMDVAGFSVRLLQDGNYEILGIVKKNGKNLAEGLEPGDLLLAIDGQNIKGKTMGIVSNALKGKPGDKKILLIGRKGNKIEIIAEVQRCI